MCAISDARSAARYRDDLSSLLSLRQCCVVLRLRRWRPAPPIVVFLGKDIRQHQEFMIPQRTSLTFKLANTRRVLQRLDVHARNDENDCFAARVKSVRCGISIPAAPRSVCSRPLCATRATPLPLRIRPDSLRQKQLAIISTTPCLPASQVGETTRGPRASRRRQAAAVTSAIPTLTKICATRDLSDSAPAPCHVWTSFLPLSPSKDSLRAFVCWSTITLRSSP